jgi:poly-gamma-glutamate capsule biosynthesis protein CapA/YwtB (metallophosphatase superfamily)
MVILAVAACTPTDWVAQDHEAWEAWRAVPITVRGRVDGPPVGAELRIDGELVALDADGTFTVERTRANAVVTASAPGHHAITRPIWLARDDEVVEVAYRLEPVEEDVARLLFGGDVMFGRRFVDVDGTTDRAEPYPSRADAFVDAADPLPGATDVLARIEPLLQTADLTSVNFESPFVRTPNTPHPEKDFVFYSDPATLPALRANGVDYVGLGNNHVYDYLQDGLRQTLDTVQAAQMPYSGAGTTPADAWAPWDTQVRDLSLSWFAATSIDGWRWDPANSYVADLTKGGAANLQDVRDMVVIQEAVDAGRRTVVQVHTGVEYAHGPSERVREHVDNVLANGADLVIGHHPHTAQGFSELDGVFVAWSLGNLAFDGLRLETLLGAMVEVDLGPDRWERARVYPVYLEDFRPRMLTGPTADRALRQLSEFSEGLAVVGEEGVGRIVPLDEVMWETRTVEIPIEADERGLAVVDLRDHARPDESVLSVSSDAPTAQVQFGRDLMGYSGFEDHDVDEGAFEVGRWDHTAASTYPCRTRRTGVGGLCSVRSHTDLDISVLPFRNRIRVFGDAEGEPEKNLTILGWQKADGAGEVDLRLETHASFGETIFGEEVVGTLSGGTFDWTRFAFDFTLPEDLTPDNDPSINPRAIRLFLDHQIPRERGAGRVAFDDLAVVGWSDAAEELPAVRTQPHPNDFLRMRVLPGAWTVTVELGRATL